MKGRSASKIKLTSYDELLGGGEETNDIQQVSLEHLHSFENHPFQVNDDEAMAELVESVKEEGILTALLVRPLGDGEYEIIAGHRRRHAAQLAGLKEVPVIIRNYSEQEIVEISLIENIQREDLNPIEEALAYKRLLTEFNLKQDEVAERVSKSRTAVTNSMRLLKLCDDVQQMIIDDLISTGHARALISIEDPEQQYAIAQQIFDELRKRKIYVRHWNKPRIENYLRITIGTPEQMEKLCEALAEILG